jgi:hypothetical protein
MCNTREIKRGFVWLYALTAAAMGLILAVAILAARAFDGLGVL